MKYSMKFLLPPALLILAVGCSTLEEPEPVILNILPADGTTQVSKTTAVTVEFNEAMNIESCESLFGMYSGELQTIPRDREIMRGRYSWNEDQTMMTFHPDSTLMDSSMYSICLEEGMQMRYREGRMGMNGMMDFGRQTDSGVISRFMTE